MAAFTVTVDDRDLPAYLDRLARRGGAKPVMEDIARALANRTEDAFQAEASPFGPKWPALTGRYVKRARKHGGRGGDAHPILQRHGGLTASITHGASATEAWVGASKEYAAIHQFGGTAGMAPGPAAIPPRPYLPVSPDGELSPTAEREILEILRRHLES